MALPLTGWFALQQSAAARVRVLGSPLAGPSLSATAKRPPEVRERREPASGGVSPLAGQRLLSLRGSLLTRRR